MYMHCKPKISHCVFVVLDGFIIWELNSVPEEKFLFKISEHCEKVHPAYNQVKIKMKELFPIPS